MELEMSRLRRIVVLCTTLALSGRVFGGTVEWPEFRGPTGQGISLATNVPIRWSAAESVKWKAAIAPGWSSPVVSAGHIYLTAAVQNGNNISLHALCFDESDARSVWDVEVLQPVPADTKKIHSKNSLASPTPIVRDGRIFVH